MSWSVNYIGKPEKIAEALEQQSEKLTGQSKTEFDAALPHLCALVKQNFNKAGDYIVQLDANGHGYDGFNNCNVSIKAIGGGILL